MANSREPEYLHQARVGLRRLRSALRAFAPILQQTGPLKRALRRLAPALGAARDADVLLATLEAAKAGPPALRAARAYRNQARAAIPHAALEGFLFQALRWLDAKPWTETEHRLADFAAERLERLHGKVMQRPQLGKAKGRHRLRVRLKRLRYACEFTAPAFAPAAVDAYVHRLRALQDILGDLNDLSVGRRRLRKLGVARPAALARREARLRPKLAAAWKRFEALRPYWRPPARRPRPAAR
jgi:CHAD domain-containing protein